MRRREGGRGRDSGLGVLLCVVAVFRISLRSNPSRLLPSGGNTPAFRTDSSDFCSPDNQVEGMGITLLSQRNQPRVMWWCWG